MSGEGYSNFRFACLLHTVSFAGATVRTSLELVGGLTTPTETPELLATSIRQMALQVLQRKLSREPVSGHSNILPHIAKDMDVR